ncbi:MAG TPA: endolytic transglycosylase MltG [Candidatus Limiplasma sp.]|nr:endolytic transglycosylase MltG [Candidatus Limiplasma sp.]
MANRHRNHSPYDPALKQEERKYGFYWYNALWRLLRSILIIVAALVLVFGLLSGLYNTINEKYFSAVDPQDQTEIAFSIENGQSLSRVAANLEEAGLIRNHSVFKYYCDFIGFGQKIQAGDYLITKDMDVFEIAELLTTGDGKPLTAMITVIPGWTVTDIADMLVEQGVLSDAAEFLSLCKSGDGLSDYYFIADELETANVSQRRYLLEGYLAPDTYEVYTDTTATAILKKLLDQTDVVLDYAYQQRAEELGMTMDQVLILASMIEKEAKTDDFSKVSAVFYNRLKSGMKLGSDATINYITGESRLVLTTSDLAVDSLYNTYTHTGLPLGPICNPSEDAIYAALYPDSQYVAEQYLYFCAKDPESGELAFSKTLEEHNIAVSVYQPLWEAYDQERGYD